MPNEAVNGKRSTVPVTLDVRQQEKNFVDGYSIHCGATHEQYDPVCEAKS